MKYCFLALLFNFSVLAAPHQYSDDVILPKSHLDGLKNYHSHCSVTVYFPCLKSLERLFEKKSNDEELSELIRLMVDERNVITYRDSITLNKDWIPVFDKFNFKDDFHGMSPQFVDKLMQEFNFMTRLYKSPPEEARKFAIKSSVNLSWQESIQLLRETYPEGKPKSLEDAVALIFLHVQSPELFSESLGSRFISIFSDSHKKELERKKELKDKKERSEMRFLIECLANAMALLEGRDALEMFGTEQSRTDSITSDSSSIDHKKQD